MLKIRTASTAALPFIIGFLALSGIGGSIFFFTHEPNNQGFIDYPNITNFLVIPGAICLALAPFQFSETLRKRSLNTQRFAGRVLSAIGLVVGATALFLGLIVPYSGVSEQLVIGFFGVLFLFSIVRGFLYIRSKEIALHREWMMRAFAIGLSIATMRLIFIPALIIVGNPTRQEAEMLSIIAFTIAFVLHCSIAEIWIRTTRKAIA
jgi:uncharacterized membrane protein